MVGCMGCGALRGPDPNIELLQSELRWYEDNLYALDEQLRQCCDQLESARRHNAQLRQELATATATSSSTPMATPAPAEPSPQPDPSPAGGFDVPSEAELYDLSSPVVEIGEPDAPEATAPAEDEGKTSPAPSSPDEGDTPSAAQPIPAREVTRIVLNPKLTGGYHLDRKPGHDGVMVVIEPQNQDGEYVPRPAPLLVQVADPKQPGAKGRWGKWTFTASECQGRMKTTTFGKGVHLELPWPESAPSSEELVVTVVYQDSAGPLRASRPIRVRRGAANVAQRPTPPAKKPSWSPHRSSR